MTEKLIEALRFYADPATYQAKGHPQIDADMKPINYDRGAIAREAIRYHEAMNPPSRLYATEGEWITCEGGHRIARFTCDVYTTTRQDLPTHLTDWQQPAPEVGSSLPKFCDVCGKAWADEPPRPFHFADGWRGEAGKP